MTRLLLPVALALLVGCSTVQAKLDIEKETAVQAEDQSDDDGGWWDDLKDFADYLFDPDACTTDPPLGGYNSTRKPANRTPAKQ